MVTCLAAELPLMQPWQLGHAALAAGLSDETAVKPCQGDCVNALWLCWIPGDVCLQDAMRAGETASVEGCPVKMKLVAPPLYVLTTQVCTLHLQASSTRWSSGPSMPTCSHLRAAAKQAAWCMGCIVCIYDPR